MSLRQEIRDLAVGEYRDYPAPNPWHEAARLRGGVDGLRTMHFRRTGEKLPQKYSVMMMGTDDLLDPDVFKGARITRVR